MVTFFKGIMDISVQLLFLVALTTQAQLYVQFTLTAVQTNYLLLLWVRNCLLLKNAFCFRTLLKGPSTIVTIYMVF